MIDLPAKDRHRLAAELRINEQYLYQCLTGRRAFPVDRCADIERHAAVLELPGLTRKELRPDDWARIWPELIGQPVAPTVEAKAA